MKKGWKSQHQKQLKKLVYAMSENTLNKLVLVHEERGWERASEIKKHGYGVAMLMAFPQKSA